MKHTILIIEDDSGVGVLLKRKIERLQYPTLQALTGEQALEIFAKYPNKKFIVFLDYRLPDINGDRLIEKIRQQGYDFPFVIITGYGSEEIASKMFKLGVYDYIIKNPGFIDMVPQVLANVINKIRLYEEIQAKSQRIENLTLALVTALETANLLNDTETGNHIIRVRMHSKILAEVYGCDETFVHKIELYSSLHDIGKVGISDSLLKKSERYTSEESKQMQEHVTIGARMLNNDDIDPMAKNIVLYHHERWDGYGYVQGLQKEEIPLEARIVALVDVFDALISKRVYKAAYSVEESVKIIRDNAEKHFDPTLVSAFMQCYKTFNSVQKDG